jgi:hypothetical protein
MLSGCHLTILLIARQKVFFFEWRTEQKFSASAMFIFFLSVVFLARCKPGEDERFLIVVFPVCNSAWLIVPAQMLLVKFNCT